MFNLRQPATILQQVNKVNRGESDRRSYNLQQIFYILKGGRQITKYERYEHFSDLPCVPKTLYMH